MGKRRYTAEEIVTVLRQVEVAVANGKATPHACRESGITEQTAIMMRVSSSAEYCGRVDIPNPVLHLFRIRLRFRSHLRSLRG